MKKLLILLTLLFTSLNLQAEPKYLILTVNSEVLASEYSIAFWDAIMPPAVRNADNVTNQLIGWLVHPTDGRVALELPDTLWRIHPLADTSTILALLGSQLPPAEQLTLQQAFTTYQQNQTPVTLEQLIPATFSPNIQTIAQLTTDGWFPGD